VTFSFDADAARSNISAHAPFVALVGSVMRVRTGGEARSPSGLHFLQAAIQTPSAPVGADAI
jgi:hypothetical protein